MPASVARKPRVRIYYHVFHPSANVSARHFGDLAEGLAQRGWEVTACPAIRDYPDGSVKFAKSEQWNGVQVERVWRPNWNQSSNRGRLGNAAWMIAAWGMQAFARRGARPDVIIIGTDPILSVLAAIPWKWTRPGVAIAHWGFDIYPEAPVADGMLNEHSLLVRTIKVVLRLAYRCCDLMADIGPCMRMLLGAYGSRARVATLTPWALVEPPRPASPVPAVRHELFGTAQLGLLYSGTFGRAHSYEGFLALARRLRGEPVALCFAGRGNRADQLKAAVTPDDTNIRFAGFAPESELEKRLGAADVHLASLRPEWTGTVVPSKFFGSLAAGRPVLFAGAGDSAIARWVGEHQVGWVITPDNIDDIARQLQALSREPARLTALHQRCHEVYHRYFDRATVIDGWDGALRRLLPPRLQGGRA